MSEERKKGGVRPWGAILLIALPVLYVASAGPACWIASRTDDGEDVWNTAYRPLIVALLSCPDRLRELGERYLLFGAPKGTFFWRDFDELRWKPFVFDEDLDDGLLDTGERLGH
jgi:hypothetical protein